jgi:hypothetical protein
MLFCIQPKVLEILLVSLLGLMAYIIDKIIPVPNPIYQLYTACYDDAW